MSKNEMNNHEVVFSEIAGELEQELGLFEETAVEVKVEELKVEEPVVEVKETPKKETKVKQVKKVEILEVKEAKVEKPKKEKVKKEPKAKVEKAPKESKPKKSKAISHEFVETKESVEGRLFELAVTDKQGTPSPRWRIFIMKTPVGHQLGVVERKTNGKINADGTPQRVRCEYIADGIDGDMPIFNELQLKEIPKYVYAMAVQYVAKHKDTLAK